MRVAAVLPLGVAIALGAVGCRAAAPIATKGEAGAYLDASAISIRAILPDPPAVGSMVARCEIEGILVMQAETPEATRVRMKEEETLTVSAFKSVLGSRLDPKSMPRTMAILEKAAKESVAVAHSAKEAWDRPRPPKQDARVKPLVELPTNASYPSGHAALAMVWAKLLSQLAPDRAEDLERRARLVAWDRVVAGVHFPSDVAAGLVLGDAVARRMLESPALKAELEEARGEWMAKAAH